jgi:hypothetical protein
MDYTANDWADLNNRFKFIALDNKLRRMRYLDRHIEAQLLEQQESGKH